MRVDVENPNPGANASVSTTGTAVPTSATLVGGSDGTPRVYRIHRHATRVIGDDANLVFPLFPLSSP